MFSCVWLHFKKCFEKYFLMFGYVFENIIENTFSTCCSHFSHIFSVAKRIYNIIHSLKHKQNPEKNHQIRTFRAIAIDASCDRDWRGAGDVGGQSWQSKLWTIQASSALDDLYSLFFLSPSLSFSRSLLTFSHIFLIAKRIYNIIHSSKHK